MCDASKTIENKKINMTTLVKVRSKLKRKRKDIEEQENNRDKRKAGSDPIIPIPVSPVLSIDHADENQAEILDKGTATTDERINNRVGRGRPKESKTRYSTCNNALKIRLRKIQNMKQRKENNMALQGIKKLPKYAKIHQILTEPEKVSRKRKRQNQIPTTNVDHLLFWNSYSYLAKQIEKCLLQNDWNNFTKLLILITDAPKKYKQFIMKTTLLNFICNPASQENKLHCDYLKEGLSCQNDEDVNKLLTAYFHIQKVDPLQENNNM